MMFLRLTPAIVFPSLVLAVLTVAGMAGASSSEAYPVGDLNCDFAVTAEDSLVVLQELSALEHESCTGGVSVTDPFDLDCSGGRTGSDALLPLLYEAGLPADNGPECPELGAPPGTPTPGPEYTLTEIVPALAEPKRGLGLVPIPGEPDEALLVIQTGLIYRVSLSGAFAPTVWGDLTDPVVSTDSEEGLLSVVFSPDYETSRRVYIYYNRPPTTGYRYGEVLSRFEVLNDALYLGSEEKLLDLDDRGYYHNGGGLAFGPDGYLYLSIGDEGYQNEPVGPALWLWNNAQDLSTLFGKVIRIDVSGDNGYTIPPDNPFVDGADGNRDEIYALGFRNPWRLGFDQETGDLWVGDVGYFQREEINRIQAGTNYGWPLYEGTHRGPLLCVPPGCDPADYTPPVYEYCQRNGSMPPCEENGDCAVVGGYIYHGEAMPELEGWYIFGDWCSGVIRAFNPGPPAEGLGTATVLFDSATIETGEWHWVSSLGLLPDGEIAVVLRNTYQANANTRVFRLDHLE